MTPEYLKKQPWEDLDCSLNLSATLASGDSVSNATVAVYDANGNDVSADMKSSDPTVSNNVIYFKIRSGIHDNHYWAEIRATTANGVKIEEDLKIIVSDKRLEA